MNLQKTERDSGTSENVHMAAQKGTVREFGMVMYILLYSKWIITAWTY